MMGMWKNQNRGKFRENWDKCFEWFLEMSETFHKVFSPRVKQL